MAVVNKFNVNKQEVTLDVDIIENMSANNISYDASTQYDKNTVGGKLSELEQEVMNIEVATEELPLEEWSIGAIVGDMNDVYVGTVNNKLPDFQHSKYIDISQYSQKSSKIIFSKIIQPNKNWVKYGLCFYSSRNPSSAVGGVASIQGDSLGYEDAEIEVPANAMYVRFTKLANDDSFIHPVIKYNKGVSLNDKISLNEKNIGDIASLSTSDKTSLVNAINEVRNKKYTTEEITDEESGNSQKQINDESKQQIESLNVIINGDKNTKVESLSIIDDDFLVGSIWANPEKENFGTKQVNQTAFKYTDFIDISKYADKEDAKLIITIPHVTTLTWVNYGLVFYTSNNQADCITDGATRITSSTENGIDIVEVNIPSNAVYFRTTFWPDTTYGEFSAKVNWSEISKSMLDKIDDIDDRVKVLENDSSDIGNDPIDIEQKYWAVCGDSITNANHQGIETIAADDPYCPIDGYTDVDYKRKNYAYYYCKRHHIKWANYGWGGTTLHECNSKAYPNLHPFVTDRIKQLKADVNWDYITIFFGWNDLQFGVVYQKDKWLQETYREDIGYPVNSSQIGTSGFATEEQKAACDSAVGSVGGVSYTDNTEYFIARMIGTINDTDKDTYMGAYNYAVTYFLQNYPNSKLMIIVPFMPNHGQQFYDAIKAIADKYSITYFDFENLPYWYRLRKLNTTEFRNPNDSNGKWYDERGHECPANIQGFNRSRYSADSTHPSNLGYRMLAEPLGSELENG